MAELRGHVREELADPRGGPDPRPQRLPQDGDRVVRRGPAVVRPARQAGQLPARRLPGLRRPRRVRPAGPPALPARGLGRRPGPPREVPRPRGRDLPGVVADRRRPARAVPQGPAPRLGHRRRRDRPPGAVPRLAPAARRAVRARRALQHERPRPGVPAPPAAACRPGPQAGGAVPPGRRLGGAATGRRGGPG